MVVLAAAPSVQGPPGLHGWPQAWLERRHLLERQHDRLEALLADLLSLHGPETPAWTAVDALACDGACRRLLWDLRLHLRLEERWLREADFARVNVDLICGLPLQTPERFRRTLELVQELRPDRVALFSFAYLPEQLPLQRRIAAGDLPSQRQRLTMLEEANQLLCGAGYEAIGMDHYALAGDGLAVAARQGLLHRNFQGYTTGGELELLGVGPTAISQFPHLFSQNQRDLKAWSAALEQGQLPVERGLEVRDPQVLERRELIRQVMCRFALELDLRRFAPEWEALQALAADGLVQLSRNGERGALRVTASGRWLIRTIAAVFDPQQRRCASGSRLV